MLPRLLFALSIPLLAAPDIQAMPETSNESASITFQKTGGFAGIKLREQSASDYYYVRLDNNNKLEFLKLESGTTSVLGSRTLPVGQEYQDGQQWTIHTKVNGHVISGSLLDSSNQEVTSGTVFDRSFLTGASTAYGAGVTTWGTLSTTALPSLVTGSADLQNAYDVIIVGAGTGGSIAAIQAARLGSSVLLVEETDWIGGQMAAAAVSSMDEGNHNLNIGVTRDSVRERGLYKEFVDKANHHYETVGLSTDTCYIDENHFGVEPRVGQALLYEMFQETNATPGQILDVTLETSVTSVLKSGSKVTGVQLRVPTATGYESKTINSKILIDATEYGDILPLAGARYRIGNWISSNDNSTTTVIPPIQEFTWTSVIKQYPSGAPSNLLVSTPPTAYGKYYFENALNNPLPYQSSSPWSWERFIGYRGMPNSENPEPGIINPWAEVTKTHTNIGANDVHIDAMDIENLEARNYKFYLLKLQTLKLLHYFQNDMNTPVTDWTVNTDEGFNTPFNQAQNAALINEHPDLAPYEDILNQFPVIPYARESRRMIGVHTVRAAEIDRRTGPRIFPTSVAVGDYGVDLHGASSPDVLESDLDKPEDLDAIGFAGNKVGPFTIPFEAFIPETLDGFLAAEKNISQSRLVNGATRLQPSTMLMGQAAGAIAGISVRESTSPRALNPARVQKALLDAGDVLYASKYDLHKFPGVTVGSDLWKSLQLGLLYGHIKLSDTNLVLDGWNVLSGGSGNPGWHFNDNGDYEFIGTTGIATYSGNLLTGDSATTAADYTVSTRFTRSAGAGTVGLVGRLTNSANFYHARIYQGALQLYKWTNNTAASLGAVSTSYVNGQTWTLSMKFEGNQVTASLYDQDGNLHKTVSASDNDHLSGVAGLRAQPGTGSSAIYSDFTITSNDSTPQVLYYTGYPEQVNVATDSLTRGQLAVHLARYYDLSTTVPVTTPSYLDVPSTHPAFNAIEALHAANILTPESGNPMEFHPDTIATKAELAQAIIQALGLNPASAPATPYFTDVPESHPAFSYIQLIAKHEIGAAVFLQEGTLFHPDSPLGIADSINLYADLLVNPPSIGDQNPITNVENWESY